MKAKRYKPRRFRTTLLPAYVLYIKGKLDSKKGITAVEAYINKLVHKAHTNEASLFKGAEYFLEPTRKEASSALFTLSECDENLAKADSKVLQHEKKSATAKKSSAADTVIESNEIIIHVHSITEEQSVRIRSYNDRKIAEYFKGINPEHKIDYIYSDEAKTKYYAIHNALDKAIRDFAESAYCENTEVTDDEKAQET